MLLYACRSQMRITIPQTQWAMVGMGTSIVPPLSASMVARSWLLMATHILMTTSLAIISMLMPMPCWARYRNKPRR